MEVCVREGERLHVKTTLEYTTGGPGDAQTPQLWATGTRLKNVAISMGDVIKIKTLPSVLTV